MSVPSSGCQDNPREDVRSQTTKGLTRGDYLREEQVDVPSSVWPLLRVTTSLGSLTDSTDYYGNCAYANSLRRCLGPRSGVLRGFTLLNTLLEGRGWHTLVGGLFGIWIQSGIAAASKYATVRRHIGEAAVPEGKCEPCPDFAS